MKCREVKCTLWSLTFSFRCSLHLTPPCLAMCLWSEWVNQSMDTFSNVSLPPASQMSNLLCHSYSYCASVAIFVPTCNAPCSRPGRCLQELQTQFQVHFLQEALLLQASGSQKRGGHAGWAQVCRLGGKSAGLMSDLHARPRPAGSGPWCDLGQIPSALNLVLLFPVMNVPDYLGVAQCAGGIVRWYRVVPGQVFLARS